jgi:hypothetical protein
MADFFATRAAIKARIEQEIPEIRRVEFAEDLDGVKESTLVTPSVHVLYAGYSPAQTERARVDITLTQTWAVVLVIKSQQQPESGLLLDKLVQVLHGFKPGNGVKELALTNSPFSPSYRPRVAYYPLAFETIVINRKGA